MPLVVDAFNVLHVTGVLPPEIAGLDLNGLADLIEASGLAKDEVWIVCDGMKPLTGAPRRRERVWFSWAGGGAKADDLIIQLVQRSTSPRRMTIVTADRAVQRAVKRRGAEVEPSDAFLARLAADWVKGHPNSPAAKAAKRRASPRESLPLAKPEVRAWLKMFGLDEAMRELSPAEAERAKPSEPRVRPVSGERPVAKPNSVSAKPVNDDPLDLANLDLDRLLAGTPPPRDGKRAARRTRRDRRP
jgi:predicted RNA-binding protein with PIN domain